MNEYQKYFDLGFNLYYTYKQADAGDPTARAFLDAVRDVARIAKYAAAVGGGEGGAPAAPPAAPTAPAAAPEGPAPEAPAEAGPMIQCPCCGNVVPVNPEGICPVCSCNWNEVAQQAMAAQGGAAAPSEAAAAEEVQKEASLIKQQIMEAALSNPAIMAELINTYGNLI